MIISAFNATWFLLLALSAAAIIVVTKLLKDKDRRQKLNTIMWISIVTFIVWIIYKLGLYLFPEQVGTIGRSEPYVFNLWDELPLQPCNTMLWLGIFACAFDWKPVMAYGFYIGMFCALMALMMPEGGFYGISLFTFPGFGYYVTHFMVIVIGVLFVTTGLIEVSYKSCLKAMLFFMFMLCVVHIVNIILRATVFPEATYYYTFDDPDNNFILAYIRTNLVKVDLLYMICPVALACFPADALVTFIIKLFTGKKEKKTA